MLQTLLQRKRLRRSGRRRTRHELRQQPSRRTLRTSWRETMRAVQQKQLQRQPPLTNWQRSTRDEPMQLPGRQNVTVFMR